MIFSEKKSAAVLPAIRRLRKLCSVSGDETHVVASAKKESRSSPRHYWHLSKVRGKFAGRTERPGVRVVVENSDGVFLAANGDADAVVLEISAAANPSGYFLRNAARELERSEVVPPHHGLLFYGKPTHISVFAYRKEKTRVVGDI